jgi:hypothetical protein
MDLRLSENERNVIRLWAEHNIHGGHWGDGDLEIPEEKILLEKIDNMKNGVLSLNDTEARIIMLWSRSTLGIHNIEEDSVIRKLMSSIQTPQFESE